MLNIIIYFLLPVQNFLKQVNNFLKLFNDGRFNFYVGNIKTSTSKHYKTKYIHIHYQLSYTTSTRQEQKPK